MVRRLPTIKSKETLGAWTVSLYVRQGEVLEKQRKTETEIIHFITFGKIHIKIQFPTNAFIRSVSIVKPKTRKVQIGH